MRTGVLLAMEAREADTASCFERAIATARQAEQEGYAAIWIGETDFDRTRPASAPLVFAGALAAETATIRLGVMAKITSDHPIKIAEDAAVLDLLSGGRVLFGADPAGSDGAGARHCDATRWSRFTEALDIIVNAWNADGFAYLGEHYTLPLHTQVRGTGCVTEPYAPPYVEPWQRVDRPFDYLSVMPKPAQLPHPPVFVVVSDDAAAAFAAARGHSPLIPAGVPPDRLRSLAVSFRRASAACGRARVETLLTVVRSIYVHADAGPAPSLDDGVVAGTPGAALDHIKQLQSDTGLGQIVCRFDPPGVTRSQAADSLARFAADVRPRLEM